MLQLTKWHGFYATDDINVSSRHKFIVALTNSFCKIINIHLRIHIL